MRHVIFCAPYPLETTLRFVQALAGLDGVRVTGVFQQPPKGDGARFFHDVALVERAFDTDEVAHGCKLLVAKHGPPHRILGVLEELQVLLARVRAHFGWRAWICPPPSVSATRA